MITLLEASAIVDASLQYARSEALAPMTVAVLDARACTVCLKLEDGSSLLRPEIARAKAWSALGMGFGTRNLAARAASLPSFFAALAALADGKVLPVPGGVLIRSHDGQIVGAAGASGDVADEDEACVVAGITAARYTPDPGAAPN
jgi:uncharacterized protein GlcG (DUF336 family)